MTFKQFNQWCNERACDGCWGMNDAIFCIELMDTMKKFRFGKETKSGRRLNPKCFIRL